jgi:bacterioferritin
MRRLSAAFPRLRQCYNLRARRALCGANRCRRRTTMRGEPGVLDFLNKGLRHELTAINQYWLHYRLLDNWGYKSLAKQWRKESIEEMQHADKLVDRIIFLDGFPNMQVLDPLHIGQSVKEVLDCDLASEMSARALYEEAATHCHAVKDYVSRDLFEKLMHDEEAHIDFLETQLDLIAKLGVQLYAQHHIGKLDDDHDWRESASGVLGSNVNKALSHESA